MENQDLILLNDEDFTKSKRFAVREIAVSGSMKKNDLCFCGSTVNHCHPEIHEKSAIANLIRIYRELDQEAAAVNHSICCKGCADCCTADFAITSVEFFAILLFLRVNDGDLPSAYSLQGKRLLSGMDLSELSAASSCIFVDDTTRECKIYEVRPLICRKYGYMSELTHC